MSRVRKNDVHWYPLFEKNPSDQRTIVNENSKQGPFVLNCCKKNLLVYYDGKENEISLL